MGYWQTWFKDKIFSIGFSIGWTGYDVSKDKKQPRELDDRGRIRLNQDGTFESKDQVGDLRNREENKNG